MACAAGNAEARATVEVPIMRFEEAMETGVPDIVIAGAPGVRVVPAMEIPFGRGTAVSPFIIVGWYDGVVAGVICAGNADARGMELPPMIRLEGPIEIGVPEIVTGGAPGVRVVPAMETPLARGWAVWPLIIVGW